MKPPAINDAKTIAKRVGAQGVIVLQIDYSTGEYSGASYGLDRQLCSRTGKILDAIMEGMELEIIRTDPEQA